MDSDVLLSIVPIYMYLFMLFQTIASHNTATYVAGQPLFVIRPFIGYASGVLLLGAAIRPILIHCAVSVDVMLF